MMWTPEQTAVIVNPAAAGGKVGRQWGQLERQLSERLGAVRFSLTTAPGGATTLARQAVADGATTVLSMGGDGTHNEVINGIMTAGAGRVRLGLLPAGTGGDFRRIVHNNTDALTAAAALPRSDSMPIDVGEVVFQADDGTEQRRFFLNIASFGVGGLVDRYANASAKRLGGKVTFYVSTLRALRDYAPARVRLWVDGQDAGEHTITNILVCNSRFAGGGMMFAPDARLGDGLFDVVIIRHRSMLTTVGMSRAIYAGTHVRSELVEVLRGATVRAETVTDDPAYMDIDGEAPGFLPARFSLHHHAVQLLGVRSEVV